MFARYTITHTNKHFSWSGILSVPWNMSTSCNIVYNNLPIGFDSKKERNNPAIQKALQEYKRFTRYANQSKKDKIYIAKRIAEKHNIDKDYFLAVLELWINC